MTKKTDPLLSTIPADFLVEYGKGDTIYREGDPGAEIFIVRSGVVEILKVVAGKERRLAIMGEGDFFGEASVLEQSARDVTARASTHCQLLRLDRETFNFVVQVNPDVALSMLRRFSRHLRKSLSGAGDAGTGFAPIETQPVRVFGKTSSRARPRLVHEGTGIEFELAGSSETKVGRPDPGSNHVPDIDLSSVEEQPSTSRDHARIRRKDKHFFVVEEEPSTNGTFVNGERVKPGSPLEVKSGDTVQFGLVKMRFAV
jgi:hypothetical protein